jgi:hypothetical protein
MTFAKHYPTMRFTQNVWLALPFRDRKDPSVPPAGFYRCTDDRGKAMVGFWDAATWSGYGVRPIIVVTAPSRRI